MSSILDESACPKEISHEFDHRVRANQQQLRAGFKPSYDFIVCGAGSSGSAVARRLADNPNTRQFTAGCEVILSLSAIQTPKVLMQSCVGDKEELGRFGFPVVQHLAGVGRNLKGPRRRAPAHCRRVSPVSGAYR